jgi:hypothetical protein
MPTKGDGITKRKDVRYMARYTVYTPDGPKRKVIYGKKYKELEKKLNEARGDAARGITYDAGVQTAGDTWPGGSPIASRIPCARGPSSGMKALSGCIWSRPSGELS